jgi:hypothetical protein
MGDSPALLFRPDKKFGAIEFAQSGDFCAMIGEQCYGM